MKEKRQRQTHIRNEMLNKGGETESRSWKEK